MSRALFIFASLALIACGDQAADQATAPPAIPPAATPAPAPAPEPAQPAASAAEAAPSDPAPSETKAVATSSIKTGEPAAKEPAAEKTDEKPAAEAAPAASAGPCGEEGQPMCPLQAFMDRFVQKPMDEGDLDAVAKGLTRATKLAPVAAWNAGGASGWAGIAQAGADAASKGDTAGAKQSCKTCHKAFRSKYKAEFRTKPL